jgi:hypothetical protein
VFLFCLGLAALDDPHWGLQIVGSGLGSSSPQSIIEATGPTFAGICAAKLNISVIALPLADVERAWQLKTSARVVLPM